MEGTLRDLSIPDDLSVPSWLRVTSPGSGDHKLKSAAANGGDEHRACRRLFPLTDADHAAIAALTADAALRAAVKDYEGEKRLAGLRQWRDENPELARMDAKAKRDAKRRVSKLGIKATGRRRRNGKR